MMRLPAAVEPVNATLSTPCRYGGNVTRLDDASSARLGPQ
jgi:hypothetical protein